MLRLPENWRTVSGGKLTELLLAQLPELPLQKEFVRNLLAASLDPALDRSKENPRWPLRNLLGRYNKIVVESQSDERLLIEIPGRAVFRTIRFRIPTYDPEGPIEYDYNRTECVMLQEVDGLRAVMGGAADRDAPDVLIERGVGLWRVFVHPNNGDPLCVIEIRHDRATIETDDGRLLLDVSVQ